MQLLINLKQIFYQLWVAQQSNWMDQCDPPLCDLTPEFHYLGSQASDFSFTDTPIQKVPVYKAHISVHISGQKHYSWDCLKIEKVLSGISPTEQFCPFFPPTEEKMSDSAVSGLLPHFLSFSGQRSPESPPAVGVTYITHGLCHAALF